MIYIVLSVVAAGMLALFIVQYAASRSRRSVTARIDEVTGLGIAGDVAQADAGFVLQKRPERFEFLAHINFLKAYSKRIEKQLIAAGLLLKPTEFMFLQIASTLFAFGISVFFLSDKRILIRGDMVLLLTFIGYKFPQWALGFLMKRRITALESQLADALTMISSGLKGGYSFVQGLQMACEQLPPPISDEFQRVLHLIQLGVDAPRALRRMEDRVQSYDFSMAVTGVCIQLQTGGNLSELLERIAHTIRERIKLRRDINAATAEGRMSGIVLVSLPACIAALLFVINPDYAQKLFYTDIGGYLVKIWIFMQFCGIMWIRKLLDFDA